MELRLLRYFLTIAKEQSFTKAAEQLHITQPTDSGNLKITNLDRLIFTKNGEFTI